MIPLRVLTLVFSGPDHPAVLILEPKEEIRRNKSRIVPIWIGSNEAAQIGISLEHIRLSRPMTHDLFLDAITNLDARIDHVLINKVVGQTFYAQLVLRQGKRLIRLDARPTDALALCIRQSAPFYINEDVLKQASYPYVFKHGRNEEAELEEFRSFLQDIVPEDFDESKL